MECLIVGCHEVIFVSELAGVRNVLLLLSDAHSYSILPADEISIDTFLCLLSQILIITGQYDDETVSTVSGLVHQSDIGTGLSGLHVS